MQEFSGGIGVLADVVRTFAAKLSSKRRRAPWFSLVNIEVTVARDTKGGDR